MNLALHTTGERAHERAAAHHAALHRAELAPAAVLCGLDAAALRNYRAALERHDWGFEWSDDSRIYAEGRDRLAWLRRMQPKVDPDLVIWNSVAPTGYRADCGQHAPTKAELLAAMKALIDAADASLDRGTLLQGAKANAFTAWSQAGGSL